MLNLSGTVPTCSDTSSLYCFIKDTARYCISLSSISAPVKKLEKITRDPRTGKGMYMTAAIRISLFVFPVENHTSKKLF